MKMKAAILQTKVFPDKEKNIRQLEDILASGKTEGADLVTLPEMFACPITLSRYEEEAAGGAAASTLYAAL